MFKIEARYEKFDMIDTEFHLIFVNAKLFLFRIYYVTSFFSSENPITEIVFANHFDFDICVRMSFGTC